MSLRVQDFENTTHAASLRDVETAINKRFGGVNSFWLSHDDEKSPALSMLVRDDLAYLLYFPNDSHPGFASVGDVTELKRGESTIFFLDTPQQEQEILNEFVIHFSKAVEVVKEFFASKDRPRTIQWFEL